MANKTQQKKERKYVIWAGIVFALAALWAAASFATPDWSDPRLSAQYAPTPPLIETAWRESAPTQRRLEEAVLKKGDTLANLLRAQGVAQDIAARAISALRKDYDPRDLAAGQKLRLYWQWQTQNNNTEDQTPDKSPDKSPDKTDAIFAGFDFLTNARTRVIIARTSDGGFSAKRATRRLSERPFFIDALITHSLYQSARAGGLAPQKVVDLIRLFSFNIDFQRDIREGDRLELLYTRRFDDSNRLAEEGDIIFTALTNRGKRHVYWRFARDDGTIGYYNDKGESAQRLLMRTPIDGARLSSSFGRRKHPILGYTRLHKGLDFAAPIGTPVYAAGSGTIEYVGRNGAYGKYMRIRHTNGFKTAYAHLNGYARGLKRGSAVQQGEVIAYVGNTGRSTGPHLHYEVHRNGVAINPRTLNAPSGGKLTQAERARLAELRESHLTQIDQLASAN